MYNETYRSQVSQRFCSRFYYQEDINVNFYLRYKHNTTFNERFFFMNLYIKSNINDKEFIAYIRREVHIVNNLKIKLLLDMNIMTSKRIIINLDTKQLTFNNCRKLIITLNVTTRNNARIR